MRYFLIILISSMCIESITSNKSNSQIVDKKFLRVYNNLKHSMIRRGSKISNNLGVKFITKDNRFIIATENIKKNTDIIRIPIKRMINIKNPKILNFCKNLGLREFKNEEILLNNDYDYEYNCLQIWMLNETKYPSKEYKQYIDTLPKSWDEYYHFWPKKDQEKVKHTITFNNDEEEGEFKNLKNKINRTKLKNKFTDREIKFAILSIRSRVFEVNIGGREYTSAAPYMDMFNYSTKTNTEWSRKLKNENDDFYLKADNNIKKNKEITLDYGNDSNNVLLSLYGFTLEYNPFPKHAELHIPYKKKIVKEWIYENNSKCLIELLKKLEKVDIENGSIANQKDYKNYIIGLFEIIRKKIRSHQNPNMIKKIKRNMKDSPNNINILRSLQDEEKLIRANLGFINEIEKVIKEGEEYFTRNKNKKVIKENYNFFKGLFEDI